MKKTYIAPVCEIVKLNATDIIATSTGTLGRGYNGDDQSYGRGSDGWDED